MIGKVDKAKGGIPKAGMTPVQDYPRVMALLFFWQNAGNPSIIDDVHPYWAQQAELLRRGLKGWFKSFSLY